jgi:hypothetical protein
VAGSREHENELSGSIEGRELIIALSGCDGLCKCEWQRRVWWRPYFGERTFVKLRMT